MNIMILRTIECRFFYFLLMACAVVSAGCVHINTKLTLTHFESGEVITGMANTITGEVSVTMPSGEILAGKFTDVKNSLTDTGEAYAVLKSSKSKLILELRVTYDKYGSGFGEAHSNDGKNYKVQF